MKLTARSLSIIVLLTSQTNLATANELNLYPEIGVGWRNYDYQVNSKVFDTNFPSIKFGLTGAYGKLFSNISFETNLSTGSSQVSSKFQTLGDTAEIKRDDLSVTIGYKVWDSLSIFSGYKYGNSDIDIASLSLNSQNSFEIIANGFFTGVSYALNIGPGNIGIKGSYAWIDSELDTNNVDYDGEGNGYNVGAKWIAPLAGKVFYSVDIDYHSYEYDDLRSNGNSFADIEENQISGRIGILYQF